MAFVSHPPQKPILWERMLMFMRLASNEYHILQSSDLLLW